jgi:hypothetical protein
MDQRACANSTAARVLGAAAPLLTLALLIGMACLDRLWVDPHEADAFHAKVRAALDKMPRYIPPWTMDDQPIPPSAVQLLKPNAMLCRQFKKVTGVKATLLVTQCRDSRDMLGHYPPVCYRGQGYEFVCRSGAAGADGVPQEWEAGDMKFKGMEYEITRVQGKVREDTFVRDFFVLPYGPIVADMEAVTAASKDYRTLAFGVAQIQLLCDGSYSRRQRDAIFSDLIGRNIDLIKALGSAGNAGDKL